MRPPLPLLLLAACTSAPPGPADTDTDDTEDTVVADTEVTADTGPAADTDVADPPSCADDTPVPDTDLPVVQLGPNGECVLALDEDCDGPCPDLDATLAQLSAAAEASLRCSDWQGTCTDAHGRALVFVFTPYAADRVVFFDASTGARMAATYGNRGAPGCASNQRVWFGEVVEGCDVFPSVDRLDGVGCGADLCDTGVLEAPEGPSACDGGWRGEGTLAGQEVAVDAGEQLLPAGDVDGDGTDDLLIAPSRYVGDGQTDRGGWRLVAGGPGRLDGDLADVDALAWVGCDPRTTCDTYAFVATADLDGDAIADVVASFRDGGPVRVWFGPAGGGGDLGVEDVDLVLPDDVTRVDGVVDGGDLDGDGDHELLVWGTRDAGDATWVVQVPRRPASPEVPLATVSTRVDGTRRPVPVPDPDDDGDDDLFLLVADGVDPARFTSVRHLPGLGAPDGPVTRFVDRYEVGCEQLRDATGHDGDGDGVGELWIGTSGGPVRVVPGVPTGAVPLGGAAVATIAQACDPDRPCSPPLPVPDVTGDGVEDLLLITDGDVDRTCWDVSDSYQVLYWRFRRGTRPLSLLVGGVRLVPGPITGALSADDAIGAVRGVDVGARTGWPRRLGDVDADGVDDVVLGTWFAEGVADHDVARAHGGWWYVLPRCR
jgi:hypothetical protein